MRRAATSTSLVQRTSSRYPATRRALRFQRGLDRAHRADEPPLRGPGNSLEHRADLSPCGRVEPSERLTATRREGEHARPPVLRRDGARDQAPTPERAEHPREIAGVQNEIADERARARPLAMRELEQHSRFGQRKA